MKRHTWTVTAVLALAILVAAPLAFAQRNRRDGFREGLLFGRLARAQRALGLSGAQVTQIEAIFADLKTQNATSRQSMRSGMHAALEKLIENPSDIAGAQAIIDQQSAAEAALKTNTLRAASKALNVLTAEQRAKLATLVQQHMAKRDAR